MNIRTYGYIRRYKGYDYTSYDIDGWYYWTMGAPVEETILINRAQIEPVPVALSGSVQSSPEELR